MYVTDALYALTNGIYMRYGAKEKPISKRFAEIAYQSSKKTFKKQETEEEIIDRIKKKLGAKS